MFDRRLVVLEKNRLVDGLLLATIPFAIALFALYAATKFLPGIFGVHLAVIAAVLRFSAARQNSLARPRERRVRASAEGVVVDDVAIPRAKIAYGRYQPRPAAAASSVRLFDKGHRIVFETAVESEVEGVELLAALGLDATRQRAEFRGAPPLMRTAGRSALIVGTATFWSAGVMWLIGQGVSPSFPFLIGFLIVLAMIPSKVIVGRDGVLIRWLGRKRFVPMANIVSATAHDKTAIRLELTGGKEEILHLATHKQRDALHVQHRDAVLARIREAHASHRDLGPAPDVATLVGQSGRTPAEWKEALTALENEEAGYRRASVREEDLWRVVEDPRAPEDARAGAAVLLRKSLDAEGKARVRIAAEATASPKLRVALEAAIDDTEDVTLEALDELALKKLR